MPAPTVAAGDDVVALAGRHLERLMARFESLARHAARARGLSPEDVDGILQDVRIRLWKAYPTGENFDSLGVSYLMKVVSSAVIDHLRRRRRHQAETSLDDATATEHLHPALHVPAPDIAEAEALARRLEAALSTLPRNRRIVVQLHLENFSRDEIAGMTGWTEAKVRNLLYRGLDDVRTHLRAPDSSGSEDDGETSHGR